MHINDNQSAVQKERGYSSTAPSCACAADLIDVEFCFTSLSSHGLGFQLLVFERDLLSAILTKVPTLVHQLYCSPICKSLPGSPTLLPPANPYRSTH